VFNWDGIQKQILDKIQPKFRVKKFKNRKQYATWANFTSNKVSLKKHSVVSNKKSCQSIIFTLTCMTKSFY